jgi:hypothetical protein
MQTRFPKWAKRMPADNPDMPAPMMIASYMAGKGILGMGDSGFWNVAVLAIRPF